MHKYTLFLDESGKSSLRSNEDEPFIVTGVVVEQKEVATIEGFFRYIKIKYKIPTNKPFHSYDVFEHERTKLSHKDLVGLNMDLADFVGIIPININILQVDKKLFRDALGITSIRDFSGSDKKKQMKDFPYRIMFTYFLEWFAEYIGNDDSVGDVVTDSRRSADKNLIDALEQSKSPACILDNHVKKIIKEKCTAIVFANKRYLSGVLELTDLISYVSFFHVRKQMSHVQDIQLPILWECIKNRLPNKEIKPIKKEKIQSFFNVDADGLHKFLKSG